MTDLYKVLKHDTTCINVTFFTFLIIIYSCSEFDSSNMFQIICDRGKKSLGKTGNHHINLRVLEHFGKVLLVKAVRLSINKLKSGIVYRHQSVM